MSASSTCVGASLILATTGLFASAAAAEEGLISSKFQQEWDQAKRALAVGLEERAKRALAQETSADSVPRPHGSSIGNPETTGSLPFSEGSPQGTAAPAQPDAPTRDWWIILGSYPEGATTLEEGAEKTTEAVRRCGLRPIRDQSANYDGFAPGYTILVLDAQTDRESAQQLLRQVRRCVRDAYLKQGRRVSERRAQVDP
jgi:hypothetical protein